jgi:pimeloyl-ACP methyl ester carboxylesterase
MQNDFLPFHVVRDGVRLHGRIGGKGTPLLLLHGHPQTHAIWQRVAPAWATRFKLVTMDLRGYGDSDSRRPMPGTSPTASARWQGTQWRGCAITASTASTSWRTIAARA